MSKYRVVPFHVPVISPRQPPLGYVSASMLWIVKVPLPAGPSVKDTGYGGLVSGELPNITRTQNPCDKPIVAEAALPSTVIVN